MTREDENVNEGNFVDCTESIARVILTAKGIKTLKPLKLNVGKVSPLNLLLMLYSTQSNYIWQ
jgi:hypothetical protein